MCRSATGPQNCRASSRYNVRRRSRVLGGWRGVFGSHWRELGFGNVWWQHRAPCAAFAPGVSRPPARPVAHRRLQFAASRLSPELRCRARTPLRQRCRRRSQCVRAGSSCDESSRSSSVSVEPRDGLPHPYDVRTKFVRPRAACEWCVSAGEVRPRVRTRVVTVGGETHTVTETLQVPTTTRSRREPETNVVTGATRTVTETQSQTNVITTEPNGR